MLGAARRPRSAVVQDWFFAPGGSEEVAVELAGLLPGADIITSFMEPAYRERLAGHGVRTWPFQRLLGPTPRYRSLLPFYPLWFGGLDLRAYDLVVSSSSAFAKAVRTRPDAVHIAYIHSPMRYAWDLEGYLAGSSLSPAARLAARTIRPLLRRWDVATSRRATRLIANSATVARRVRDLWGREAEVIHPPVDVAGMPLGDRDDGYLLVAARLLAYRRIDLAVAAASRLQRELVVVGDGPELAGLSRMAGPSVRFLGRLDRPHLAELFGRAHAYLVPGEEDFGMAPVEAMAAGTPVIALRAGGATETVTEGVSGIFFDRPEVDALAAAVGEVDRLPRDRAVIRSTVERFDRSVFRARFRDLLSEVAVGQIPPGAAAD